MENEEISSSEENFVHSSLIIQIEGNHRKYFTISEEQKVFRKNRSTLDVKTIIEHFYSFIYYFFIYSTGHIQVIQNSEVITVYIDILINIKKK